MAKQKRARAVAKRRRHEQPKPVEQTSVVDPASLVAEVWNGTGWETIRYPWVVDYGPNWATLVVAGNTVPVPWRVRHGIDVLYRSLSKPEPVETA